MDQLKEILKHLINYRFWIAVGISALLPMIAYLVGSGAIQQQAATEAAAIENAAKGVKPYTGGKPVNRQYGELVTAKTEELTRDVDTSWKELYDRQAPLLTWPERVQDRFTAWGRDWPKDTDASAVQIAIIDYINAYPPFVTEVYKSFQPYDYVEGTGVVAAPPEDSLLRPSKFDEQAPPGLGKVWAAQERLWIQRTLLDVVATVNKDAKDWNTAVIKQINALEVGNALAQDQQSIAAGEVLEEAPDIVDPAAPVVEAPAEDSTMSSMAAASGAAGGGGAGQAPESVFYIKSDSTAFKILPVQMTVLIDQDHIQDFLIALENSPMNIQVKDFEMSKPVARVTKPDKGAQLAFGGMGMMGSPMMMAPGGMTGYGGRAAMMQEMMASSMMMSGSMGGLGGTGKGVSKGVDKRAAESRAKLAADALKAAQSAKVVSVHDPHYNIVEVKVYGQARFFNPPPPAPAAEPSQAATPDAAAPPADGAAPAATPAPAEGAAPAPAEPKAETGTETKEAAAGEPQKADEPKKADVPKAETKKADVPKAETKKADEPKAEPKKADEPKAAPAPK